MAVDENHRTRKGCEKTVICVCVVNDARGKGTLPRPFLLPFNSEEQEEQTDYECKTTPDALALRKATNARPSRPVPSNSREDGSGVVSMLYVPP